MVAEAGEKGLGVFARRSFDQGELIFRRRHGPRMTRAETAWRCSCGAPCCTGTVAGGFFGLPADRQLAYLPHAPAFVRKAARSR